MKQTFRTNNQIRANELRVIDAEGENLGVMPTAAALKLAQDRGEDLIEISPNAVPPIAKIMDFGKFQYIQNKKDKEAKSKSHTTETKSIQIKIGTGDHDLELKAKKISEFLKEGHRVKVNLFLPGRAKYFDRKFLEERQARLLKFITENFRIAEPAQKSPKGLSLVIERDTAKKAVVAPEPETITKPAVN